MPVEIIVPELGESIVEATISRWLKQEGDRVDVGEAVVELETDKVNLEVSAEQAGVLAVIKRPQGEDVQIGDVLGLIEAAPADGREASIDSVKEAEHSATADDSETKAKSAPPEDGSASSDEVGPRETPEEPMEKATPVARRLAREHDLDLAQVPHPEAKERITKEDVERFLEARQTQVKAEANEVKEPEIRPAPADARPVREERIRMSRRRRTIARRLVEAQQMAAMLTTFNEIDMSAVIELRRRRQDAFRQRHKLKLGFMSFFVKAAVGALRQFPYLNAEIDGDEIVIKHYYDIGMAIGAEEGLVVPVIREADRLTFAEIEQAVDQYVHKVEAGKLSLEDLRGGTFSITNGGVFGSLLSTPILNPPQVGILGLHKIEKRPVVLNDEMKIRPMMYVALSYDHRLVDGREAVQFLVRVKELIEEPETLLLEG